MAGWYFNEKRPGDKIRDPIQGEFFSQESINEPGEALIREGIQNSLDAGIYENGEGVLVRIFISGKEKAVESSKTEEFLEGSWKHFQAKGNGLEDIPDPGDDCSFLVFEDFGTSGLEGDPVEDFPDEDDKNNFFYFFRAEGRSDKGEGDRGRWGVGKYVFPASSTINTIFALTKRKNDNRSLMMGQAVLKAHKINGSCYLPDGLFGEQGDQNLILPIEDSLQIQKFSESFNLQRSNEPGLSIVVPWYELEMEGKNLVHSVIRDYFWPILNGTLEVIIETSSLETILNKKSIIKEAVKLGDTAKDILPLLRLAELAVAEDQIEFVELNYVSLDRAPKWSEKVFPDGTLEKIKEMLDEGKQIAIKVPMNVQEKGKNKEETYFEIFLEPEKSGEIERPVFIREGIKITDVKAPRTRGILSLVVINDKPLASLLGDSENPSHTEWQKKGSKFKNKYTLGPSCLDYVIRSVSEISRLISKSDENEDRAILTDIFSLPFSEEDFSEDDAVEEDIPKPRPKEGPDPVPPPIPVPPSRPKRYRLSRIKGGFKIKPGDEQVPLPIFLKIQAAYNIRKGNPFKRYSKHDFQFDTPVFQIDHQGIEILNKEDNQLLVEVKNPDFNFELTGFDENRDVKVDIKVREESDDS